jgi:alpha-L-arabinofuranosidase
MRHAGGVFCQAVKAKAGDRFTVVIADGNVLMEARHIRCGDVWDCHPVEAPEYGRFAQEYGKHMVFTDEQVVKKAAHHSQWRADVGLA